VTLTLPRTLGYDRALGRYLRAGVGPGQDKPLAGFQRLVAEVSLAPRPLPEAVASMGSPSPIWGGIAPTSRRRHRQGSSRRPNVL